MESNDSRRYRITVPGNEFRDKEVFAGFYPELRQRYGCVVGNLSATSAYLLLGTANNLANNGVFPVGADLTLYADCLGSNYLRVERLEVYDESNSGS